MATTIEHTFRRFLLGVAGVLCIGTIIELWLAKHTEEPAQFIPFVLCGLGLSAILAVWYRPQRLAMRILRGISALLIAGALFGIYEHLAGNIEFKLELRPTATIGDVWLDALRGGNPLLAPGMLALTGVLASAATYRHPALEH